MDENDKRFIEELFVKQTEQFHEYIGVISENFDHKLAIVAEGHQMLSEKLERVESSLGLKIDKIAAEVTAHRADTEAHHGVYRVKEGLGHHSHCPPLRGSGLRLVMGFDVLGQTAAM